VSSRFIARRSSAFGRGAPVLCCSRSIIRVIAPGSYEMFLPKPTRSRLRCSRRRQEPSATP
jgi:hypothetical protein